ncbi:hypothetical protein [Carboxylicivirga taeanensis]|uniref:hypothetical protein n=1 Tax=Carboxylicivirga taeanensis TaxID=1416875 RepID=UPI003F6E365C
MKKIESLSMQQMQKVLGGRDVEKIDQNGDGKWDVKIVRNKNGTITKKKYRNV